jgi:hypothetical protein
LKFLLSGKALNAGFPLLGFGLGGEFFGMDEFYRPAASRISAAIAFVMVVYSAREVGGDSGIECLIAALDYVDVPGHSLVI